MAVTAAAYLPYAVKLYDEMREESVKRKIDGKSKTLWVGKMTELHRRLEIPVPYYGKVLEALKIMGCITQYRRGARTVKSVWILHRKPTKERFGEIDTAILESQQERETTALMQRVEDLHDRLGGVDIVALLKDIEKEHRTLKGRVTRLEKSNKELRDAVIQ